MRFKGGMAEAGTPVTMSDVAGLAGVSTASVSRIVNGRYDVSAIAEACSAIERPGYEPSLVATSLRRHRTDILGLGDPQFPALYR